LFHPLQSVLTARQRALSCRDANGISELVIGVALIVFGSQDYLASKLAPFGTLGRVSVVLGIIVLYGLLMLGNRAIAEWIKERLIYPRTGYASTPEEDGKTESERKGSFYAVLALALMIGVVFFASSFVIHARWICFVGTLLLFGCYVFVSGQFRLDPVRSLLFLTPLVGGLTWWAFSKPSPPFTSLLVVVGASLAFAGLICLVVYLVRNPRPSSTAP
jgi:hypothetical protein